MSPSFLSLPRELRYQICGYIVLKLRPFDHMSSSDRRMMHSSGTRALFSVSKTTHREASYVFYAKNCFCLMYSNTLMSTFLDCIGQVNSSYIETALVGFPLLDELKLGDSTLDRIDMGQIDIIRRSCPNLRTIRILSDDEIQDGFKSGSTHYPELAMEAMKLVDIHYRSIPSLREIILEIDYDCRIDDDRLSNFKSILSKLNIQTDGERVAEEWDDSESDMQTEAYQFDEEWDVAELGIQMDGNQFDEEWNNGNNGYSSSDQDTDNY